MKQRTQKSAAHWLAPHGLLRLLSYRTQGHQPRNGPANDEMDLSTSIDVIKTVPPQTYSKADPKEKINPPLRLTFPVDSRLPQDNS